MTNLGAAQHTIQATYRIVTPMFCGGAEQQAEFRLASFKGVLRFWWRALMWGRLQDLNRLRKEEAELFGSSDEGQSSFLMRLTQPPRSDTLTQAFSPGLTYLAGMGLCKADGSLHRQPLKPGGCVAIELRIKSGIHANEHLGQLRQALIATGIFGGLGSRTRRGFGSMTLESLTGNSSVWTVPKSVEELGSLISELLNHSRIGPRNEPPYSAFSPESRVVLIQGQNSDAPESLLAHLGREFVRYRAYGASGSGGRRFNVLHEEVTQPTFPEDHDDMYSFLSTGKIVTVPPKRSVFGLPHNYFFKSLSAKAEVLPSKHERRASPLLFHIHATQDHSPIAICTFMPSRFLPSDETMRITNQSQRGKPASSPKIPVTGYWQPIHDFLDRLKSGTQTKEPFDRVVEVAHG